MPLPSDLPDRLAHIGQALHLLQQIQQLEDTEAKRVLTEAILRELKPEPTTELMEHLSDPIDPRPVLNALRSPAISRTWPIQPKPNPVHKSIPHAAGEADRVKRIVDTLGAPGYTVSELYDIVDEDLKEGLANSLSYLRRRGKIGGRKIISRDTANNERELWQYFSLQSE